MGGPGSTRWAFHSKAGTVEECLVLDAARWQREGILAPNTFRSGVWTWFDPDTDELRSSIRFQVITEGGSGRVQLRYTVSGADKMDFEVRLLTTRPNYGGLRWYFTCPVNKTGRSCNHRVQKLYLPPGSQHFACRYCYELTYRSCQRHDKRLDAYLRDPEAIVAALRGSRSDPKALSALLRLAT